ncbi:formylglycine-generating enzyme family protein [Kitasatospora sp. NPDC058190]|uniref:formylglycine-generating enzyme family protein n=1 Tax=Kitasatospora sp. NPDC058190 TaxID=3346371 RepID=UPI0036D7EE87
MKLENVPHSPHFREHAALAAPEATALGEPGAGPLGALPRAELATLVEKPQATLAERLAAGGILSVLGDPRITASPATCFVAGGMVEIGLPTTEVEQVVAAWEHVGVETSWIMKETPVFTTRLDAFWIATYLVTNSEYRTFLLDSGHDDRPTTWYLGAYPHERANHPVAGVRPESADAYAAWLSGRTGHPWRLPTEAEWEHAAKGTDGRAFPWGDEFDVRAANTREAGIHTTTPVGAFPHGRSPCGALDMGGNVEEYVADDYRPYPGGQVIEDHLVETMGNYRVARGGSFSRFGDLARTRRRHGAFPGPLYPVGFRLATSEQPAR